MLREAMVFKQCSVCNENTSHVITPQCYIFSCCLTNGTLIRPSNIFSNHDDAPSNKKNEKCFIIRWRWSLRTTFLYPFRVTPPTNHGPQYSWYQIGLVKGSRLPLIYYPPIYTQRNVLFTTYSCLREKCVDHFIFMLEYEYKALTCRTSLQSDFSLINGNGWKSV